MAFDTLPTLDVDDIRSQFLGAGNFGEEAKDAPVIGKDVIDRLGDIQSGAQPEKPVVTAPAEGSLPEHLKEFEEVLAKPLKQDDTTDYAALLKGMGKEVETATRQDYADFVEAERAKEAYLANSDLRYYESIVAGGLDELKVLQDQVRAAMGQNFSQKVFDLHMSDFVEEGQLTEAGKQKHAEIVNAAKNAIKQLEQGAEAAGKKAVEDAKKYDTFLNDTAKSFKVGGVELGEELSEHLLERIRTGKVTDWLSNTKDEKELAQKELILALVSSPEAMAHWIKKVDERGQSWGATKRVARLLS